MKVDLLGIAEGNKVELTNVLYVSDGDKTFIGNPKVEGAKVIVFKYKAKVRYRKKTGHRQGYTHLAIEQIVVPGQSAEVKS